MIQKVKFNKSDVKLKTGKLINNDAMSRRLTALTMQAIDLAFKVSCFNKEKILVKYEGESFSFQVEFKKH